jgi:hypothetical protein
LSYFRLTLTDQPREAVERRDRRIDLEDDGFRAPDRSIVPLNRIRQSGAAG